MSAADVDEYLRGIEEPKRSTLEALRRAILEVVPDAEQVISYKVPAFRVDGRIVAGFAAFKDHLSYLPFSGSVLPALASELEGYTMTKSALDVGAEGAGVFAAGDEAVEGVDVGAERGDGGVADGLREVGDDREAAAVAGCPDRRLRAVAVEAADEDHAACGDGGGEVGAHGWHRREHSAAAGRGEDLLHDVVDAR